MWFPLKCISIPSDIYNFLRISCLFFIFYSFIYVCILFWYYFFLLSYLCVSTLWRKYWRPSAQFQGISCDTSIALTYFDKIPIFNVFYVTRSPLPFYNVATVTKTLFYNSSFTYVYHPNSSVTYVWLMYWPWCFPPNGYKSLQGREVEQPIYPLTTSDYSPTHKRDSWIKQLNKAQAETWFGNTSLMGNDNKACPGFLASCLTLQGMHSELFALMNLHHLALKYFRIY